MKKALRIWMMIAVVFGMTGSAFGHFGMLIPSDNMVMQNDNRSVNLQLSFSHPMEMVGMELVKPKVFSVWANGKTQNLLDNMKPIQIMDHGAWQSDYQIKRPGVYMFYMEPQPYWEPAEDDRNGVFTYATPKAGWWGFAALNEAGFKIKSPAGEDKGVEIGAVLWVHFENWQER